MNPKSPAPSEALSAADVRARHKEFLFPATSNYYRKSLVLTDGKGMRLRDMTVNASEVDEALGKLDDPYGAIGA